MGRGSDDSEADIPVQTGFPRHEARLRRIPPPSSERIAQIVVEHGDPGQPRPGALDSPQRLVQRRAGRRPPLPVEQNRRIDPVERAPHLVHRPDVVHTHQIEAEPVDMILLGPIAHGIDDQPAHHSPFGSRLVPAARRVGKRPVGLVPIVVSRYGQREIRFLGPVSVVVDRVHHHANPVAVQTPDHLLELADPHGGVVRVGRVGTLRDEIVFRIVAPVVYAVLQPALVDRPEVERGQQMDMRDAQLLQVVQPRSEAFGRARAFLGQRQILSLVFHARIGSDRQVAVVHLVNHDIGRRAHRRTQVFLPPFGIGLAQIDDRGTVAVHSDGLCPDARRLGQPPPVIKYTERIEQPLAVSRQFGRPRAVGRSIHRLSQQRTAALARAVQPQANPLGRRRPQPERGALGRIGQLEVVAPVDGIAVVCRFVFHRKSVFHIIMRKERMSCPAAVRAESAGNLRQPRCRDPDRTRHRGGSFGRITNQIPGKVSASCPSRRSGRYAAGGCRSGRAF